MPSQRRPAEPFYSDFENDDEGPARKGGDGLLGQLVGRLIGGAAPPTRAEERDEVVVTRVQPAGSVYLWDDETKPPQARREKPPRASAPKQRAAQPASPRADAHRAEARRAEPALTPPAARPMASATPQTWQRPFSLPPGVRFTRTPDAALRGRNIPPPEDVVEEPAADDLEPSAGAHAPPDEAGGFDEQIDMAAIDFARHLPDTVFWHAMDVLAPLLNDGPEPAYERIEAVIDAPPPDVAIEDDIAEVEPEAAEQVLVEPEPEPEPSQVPIPVPLPAPVAEAKPRRVVAAAAAVVVQSPARRPMRIASGYDLPPMDLLAEPRKPQGAAISAEALEANARLLESVLEDFGVRGEIIHVRPGPVVTLYELEPAPGIKSSRVIGLADDIARSMSALSARVAVVPGRNVIGIELPNSKRETVYFRELIGSQDFERSKFKLALCLGKTIGGEPVIAELAKMPHLLVAGTTGSGKSVAINTMILSLLYRLKPEQCRLIMVDPKMLELSVYDGIPHLLAPVVTDPKKAVLALKWAVREMEERYKKMSKLGVRNIDGYNQRAAEASASGETVMRTVQTGFDRETGEALYEQEAMDLTPLPYIVVIVDEMADLMMVAGKDIEGAIQRLAQMARAAGIHLIMATQRPSVDVITGTIKANFPTRISFQVTSKIDSRTILGEQGAEQLLGQGDMLHMAGGGRISRVHGPFVSDEEVEKVVAHLKAQGRPDYLDAVTAGEDGEGEDGEGEDGAVFDKGAFGGEEAADLYDQAVKIVMRDKKCSTSYIQRRLQIGYNRAASLVERMEKEGLVGPANHAGKREIIGTSRNRIIHAGDDEEMEEE